LTAFELARAALGRLFDAPPLAPTNFGLAVPLVMSATLVVNVLVARYERRQGEAAGSEFLLADAAHTRSDALVTSAVLVSWVLGRLGIPLVDPLASLVVVGLVGAVGYRVFARTVPILVDAVRIPPEKVQAVIESFTGVRGCDRLRTRGEGRAGFIECRVFVGADVDAIAAHQLTERLERRLEQRFGVPREHVTIHVEVVDPGPLATHET
jgi:cation diffusion facilitator family transporter